ncbi:MAG: hypothetical protein EXX96DRAFT_607349 [Benjaminiella poitrasii]|nr:MAG: hypothetical protein EXX96DRAFT_607349 [Benjaminiella poitrasii]
MCPISSTLYTIEDAITCILCSEIIIKATIISDCGHSFCQECLENYLMVRNACPTCVIESSLDRVARDETSNKLIYQVTQIKKLLLNEPLTPLERTLEERWQEPSVGYNKRPFSSLSENGDQLQDEYDSSSSFNKKLRSSSEVNVKKRSHDNMARSNDNDGDSDEQEDEANKRIKSYEMSPISSFDPSQIPDLSSPSFACHFEPQPVTPPPPPPQARQQTSLYLDENEEDEGDNISIPSLPSTHVSQSSHKEDQAEEDRLSLPSSSTASNTNQNPVFSQEGPTSSSSSHANKASSNTTTNSADSPSEVREHEESNTSGESAPSEEASSQQEEPLSKEKNLCDDEQKESGEKTTDKDVVWTCPSCGYGNKSATQSCQLCLLLCPAPMDPKSETVAAAVTGSSPAAPSPSPATSPSPAASPSPTPARSLTVDDEVHLLVTGLTLGAQKQLDRALKKRTPLKLVLHESFGDAVSHMVTSVNDRGLCRRTIKYCHGLLAGIWILDLAWLLESLKAGTWLVEAGFEVQGDQQSGVTEAPQRARALGRGQLLKDMAFYLSGSFKGKHSKTDLDSLCRLGGAQVMIRRPTSGGWHQTPDLVRDEPVVIVAGDEKRRPAWLKDCQVRESSWLVQCISHLAVE